MTKNSFLSCLCNKRRQTILEKIMYKFTLKKFKQIQTLKLYKILNNIGKITSNILDKPYWKKNNYVDKSYWKKIVSKFTLKKLKQIQSLKLYKILKNVLRQCF